MRLASAATPSLAITAAETAVTPPNENFRPWDACLIEMSACHGPYTTRLGHGGDGKWLAWTVLPAVGCIPAEFFVADYLAVVSSFMKPHDDGIEFPPVEIMQKLTGRSDPDFN